MDLKMTVTRQLLEQWHGGDSGSLELLLERHLPWIQEYVSMRLGSMLRRKAETVDYVQDAVVEFLRYGPRVVLNDEDHFRALLGRIVENSLRNKYDWFTAQRRAIARENPLPSDTILSLDPPQRGVGTPSESVQRHEREAWIRLGLELLEPDDKEIVILRQFEKLSHAEIGEKVGISAEAARKRHNRAVDRLSEKVWDLRSGKIQRVLQPD